jgi:hypothetical protein
MLVFRWACYVIVLLMASVLTPAAAPLRVVLALEERGFMPCSTCVRLDRGGGLWPIILGPFL